MNCIHDLGLGIHCPFDALPGALFCHQHAGQEDRYGAPQAAEENNQRWRTPRTLARSLIAEFALNHDAAADHTNNLLPAYWSRYNSALDRSWPAQVRPWLNPPFGIAEKFYERQRDHKRRGGVSLLLVIDRGTQWLQEAKRLNTFWEFTGRVGYEWPPEAPKEGGTDAPTFGSVLVLFDPKQRPRFAGFRDPVSGDVVDAR